eukprot:TRINITY_DN3741_c0_g1_i4.p1 TRINITY_DN3741_c0_g1~~TRINITY_DN3741_c0_g1_i4.p1  ORF type:complete len:469 (-),score=76.23 TRINITY_DN3741_c0_g1_i4:80-1486(-)
MMNMNPQMAAMMSTLTPQQQQMFIQQMQNPYMTNFPMNSGPMMSPIPSPSPPREQPPPPPPPPALPEKLKVNLKPAERGVYSSLYDVASAGKGSKIDGKEAAAFLQRSGLPKETLREIWEIADQNGEMALTRDNFYIALRLVALAQSGREVSAQAIASDIDAPLPKLGGTLGTGSGPTQGFSASLDASASKYAIADEEVQKYAQLCGSIDAEQKGYLNAQQMDMIMAKINLPPNAANTLKVICDEQGTNKFSLPMAVIMVHLALLALKKVPLPRAIPPSLKQKVEVALGYAQPSVSPARQPESTMPMGASNFPTPSLTSGLEMNYSMPVPVPAPGNRVMDGMSSSNDALGIIRKEINDKRAEIAELRNEESKLKAKVEQLKERNKTFGAQLQHMKDELANLKRAHPGSSAGRLVPNNNFAAQPRPMAPQRSPVKAEYGEGGNYGGNNYVKPTSKVEEKSSAWASFDFS